MQIKARIQRWVIWWFYVGVICGIIVFANILMDNFTVFQERFLLAVGAAFWLLGGFVCWAYDAVDVETSAPTESATPDKPAATTPETEWHPASDFLLPGRKKSLLPWRH